MMEYYGTCGYCGGQLVIVYWVNPKTGKKERDYGTCLCCLRSFVVTD